MFSNKISDNINSLIKVKTELKEYLIMINKKKEANQISFKIRSYKKWIIIIKEQEDILNSVSTKEEVKSLNLSSSLKDKISELMDSDTLSDINKTKDEINKIITQLENETNVKQIDNNVKQGSKILNTSSSITPEPKRRAIDNNSQNVSIPTLDKKKNLQSQRPTDGIKQIMFDLQRIYGFGPSQAKKGYEKGYTLQKLLDEWEQYCSLNPDNHIIMIEKLGTFNMNIRQKDNILVEKLKNTIYLKELTHHQLVGIKYFYDIEKRIKRMEIDKINKLLQTVCAKINKDIKATICGSYRRECSSSGDIDVLLTHPCCQYPDDLKTLASNPLKKIVRVLTDIGFLVDHLTTEGNTKYMGLCQLKNYPSARRIDIRFIPYKSYGSALLYFTGSRDFNTTMRTHCLSKGYTLNEYGLYKNIVDKETRKKTKGEFVPCETEEDFFTFLEYPYKTPKERNILK